ncbi:MAG: transglycosylase SLT domain-containing protein [Fluviicoccus sp.]|uniref:lytic transglycosylase domain-containing protein n=1 Tax=Fluviicoccus sp. TaxID=2003552 RepID=UPI00271A43F9|nr:lytic transglycosylase domain-containing protein [Fluviicoccus sp.]MDO8331189.1 transglycosylase SLT domain-containing protein [Fluviicoccus sp.]
MFRIRPPAWLPFSLLLSLPVLADDKDFLLAREAFQQGDLVTLAEAGARLQGDPLVIYADYYMLGKQLDQVSPDMVRAFLIKYPDTWLAEKLRGDYLKVLGKQGNWAAYRDFADGLQNPDPEHRCFGLLSRAELQEQAVPVLTEARKSLWFSGKNPPAPCQELLKMADDAGLIREDDRWDRLRLALQEGNTALARSLSGKMGLDLKADMLGKLSTNPRAVLARPDVETRIGHELYLAALARHSRQSLDDALERWRSVEKQFDGESRAYGWRLLALAGARKQDERAVDWFGLSEAALWADGDREWHVRMAIRAERWPEVLKAINSLSPERQQDRAWRYWRAHAMQKSGDKPPIVQAIFSGLAVDDDYYGLLARDHLGKPFVAAPQTFRPEPADVERAQLNPGLQRALRLYLLDLRTEAVREWNWALRNADDRLLLSAAEQAANARWYDRAIYAAERTKQLHSYSLRYLTPYREVAEGYSREFGIDPAWVFGLMRQESRFVTNARSTVGAGGLMQVMPSTAQWVANRLKIPYHAGMVNDVGMNIRLGTYYLSNALKNLGSQPVLATAGYNAGPGRARQWQHQSRPLEADIYVESIPFLETRDYVKKVMTNAVHYAIGFGMGPQSLSARMGVIPARNPAPVNMP